MRIVLGGGDGCGGGGSQRRRWRRETGYLVDTEEEGGRTGVRLIESEWNEVLRLRSGAMWKSGGGAGMV